MMAVINDINWNSWKFSPMKSQLTQIAIEAPTEKYSHMDRDSLSASCGLPFYILLIMSCL